ncbi:MAG TPA: hypothetical protein VGQ46_22060 [Thermoanaerobaculia bacterium]|jgi:hypothetical protein|nr:hypothetical protein [Thermoanaerobaculia bacterium]
MRVALKAGNGRFLSADGGGGRTVTADRDIAGPWETFTLIDHGNGTVSFQTINGRYLSIAPRGKNRQRPRLSAIGRSTGTSERFRRHNLAGGRISLQASNLRFIRVEQGDKLVSAEMTSNQHAEKFQLIDVPDVIDVDLAWMEAAYDKIKDKTLAQLCLPGTHDSGTYQLFDILAPDATDVIRELWNNARVGGATAIGEYIKGMAVTQTKTFYQQFEAGIRYIDLRVCFMDGNFYTCHSLRGNLISTLMEDVRQFLDENQKEVLVFKVGFKSMKGKEDDAWKEISGIVGPNFYRPGNIGELLGKRFSELVDAKAPKRAVFLLDSADNISGIYSSSITTNRGVVNNLQNRTRLFPGGTLLEAQFIRPISDTDFVRGYIQKNGCRLLGAFALLVNPVYMPVFSPILLGIVGGVGAALPAYLLYVRNFDPKPTDLVQNARDSRSILRDYIQWLTANPATKPQLLNCDFIEELPVVEISIRISTGEPFDDLVNGIVDKPPFPPTGERMVVFDCTAQVIASAFKAGAYAITEAGTWLARQMGLASRPLNQALRSAGYAGQEIVKFFNGLGGEFKKFFDNLGKWLNPKNWFRRAYDPNSPRTAADDFLDRLEEDSFREELLPAMADVEPGDWDAIVQIARTARYEFTVEELMQAVPDGFFQGAGEYPELGWDRSTLLPQAH